MLETVWELYLVYVMVPMINHIIVVDMGVVTVAAIAIWKRW